MSVLLIIVLAAFSFPQAGCVSANGFSYGYNKENGGSGGAIRTSRLTSNGRRGLELDAADKSLGEVFATLSRKSGVPVLLGLGVDPNSPVSGVFTGSTWGGILDAVCEQYGYVAEPKLYPSGKIEAYLVSLRG